MIRIPGLTNVSALLSAATIVLIVNLFLASCGRDAGDEAGSGNSSMIASTVQEVNPCPDAVAGTVAMQYSLFNPQSITLPVNSVVKWTNFDADTDHHVYSYNHPVNGWFRSSDISFGQSLCYKFSAAGVYPYKCLGESMTGVVIIQ